MKCVTVSCFDYYSIRMEKINNYYLTEGYDVTYLYADFDHFAKAKNTSLYECGEKIHVPFYNKNLSLKRLYSHYVFSKSVSKRLEEIKPDIVYCIFPPNSLVREVVRYKKKNNAVKIIFDNYDFWPESFPIHKIPALLRFPFVLWRKLRSDYLKYADLIVTVSEAAKPLLEKEAPNIPVRVLKPTLDRGEVPEYSFEKSNKISFCYLGLVNNILDIDLCVELLGLIAKHKKVDLHIIGKGQNLDSFVNRLKEASVNVICHGCIFDMPGKNEVFSMCNLGLSLPKEEIKSAMALKSIEYMRAGLPFINAGMGDSISIVEEGKIGINVNRKKLDETVNKILNIKSDDLSEMHLNCIQVYKSKFLNQSLKEILQI